MFDLEQLAGKISEAAKSGGVRLVRGQVVQHQPPYSLVQVGGSADGSTVPVFGAATIGAEVSLLVGGGLITFAPCPRVGVSAVRTTGMTTTANAVATMTWETIGKATHPGFLTAGSGTITIPPGLGGLYSISAATNASTGYTARAYVTVQVAGSVSRLYRAMVSGGSEDRLEASVAAIELVEGDTVTVQVFRAQSGTLTLTGYLDVWRIGW